ncbi:MAG: hypothetical protein QOK05_2424 [Chloroflexota bacterium]|nr:hypothetical protein [Chloroflexota bacterium]
MRSPDAELQLQGLRTALSLSLGDRQADLLVAGDAIGVLEPVVGSESAHCLDALRQVGRAIEVDELAAHSLVHHAAEVLPHDEFVERLATAGFLQVF